MATIINLGPVTGTQACATEADGSRMLGPFPSGLTHLFVMAGLVPAIHALTRSKESKTWMPGTSPGMTVLAVAPACADEILNEAREGRGHLVRKRHHAS